MNSFRPSGATAWLPVSVWQRFALFQFPEGGNEFTSAPIDADPGALRPFTVWMMRRTVNGKEEFQERSEATLEDGTIREDGFGFGRFTGDDTDWFHYVGPVPSVPSDGEYQLHRKVVTIDGEAFLLSRVIFPESDTRTDIAYYPLGRIG